MPVMGPGDNHETADEAHQEILKLLKEKYHIHYDQLCHPKMYKEDMDGEIEKLHQAILGIFRLDSWDGW